MPSKSIRQRGKNGKKRRKENQKVNKGGERGFHTHEFGTVPILALMPKFAPVPKLAPMPKIGTNAKIGTSSKFCTNAKIGTSAKIGTNTKIGTSANFRIVRILAP